MKIQNYFSKFLLSLPDLKYLNGDLIIIRKIKSYILYNQFFPNSETNDYTNIKFIIYLFSLNLFKII
jgi:hypothetical protein